MVSFPNSPCQQIQAYRPGFRFSCNRLSLPLSCASQSTASTQCHALGHGSRKTHAQSEGPREPRELLLDTHILNSHRWEQTCAHTMQPHHISLPMTRILNTITSIPTQTVATNSVSPPPTLQLPVTPIFRD